MLRLSAGQAGALRGAVGIRNAVGRHFSTLPPPPPVGLRSRNEMLASLKTSTKDAPYDIFIVGGGATGSGAALDSATRGLKVACVERGDFGSETSSRSTKLIWAGSRSLGTVFMPCFSGDFGMKSHCQHATLA